MRCPYCNEKILGFKRLCPRNVSYTDAKQGIPREYLKMQKEENTVSKDIKNWLDTQSPNTIFTHSDILSVLDLKGKTYGDKIQRVLGGFICFGLIERKQHNVKIKLNITEKGNQHIYQKKLEFEQKRCPYLKKTEIKKGKYSGYSKLSCLLEPTAFLTILFKEE